METSSYYGSSVVLQRLSLLPALPYFRLSGLGGPQLYTPMLTGMFTCMYVCMQDGIKSVFLPSNAWCSNF